MTQTSLQSKLIESASNKPGMTEPLNLTIPKVIEATPHRLQSMEHLRPITRPGTFNKYRPHTLDGRRCPRQKRTSIIAATIQVDARQPIAKHHPKANPGAGLLDGIPASTGGWISGR